MRVGQRAAHVCDQLKTGAGWQTQIGQHHIGTDRVGTTDGLCDGAGLGDDFNAVGAVEDVADAAAYYLVVIQH